MAGGPAATPRFRLAAPEKASTPHLPASPINPPNAHKFENLYALDCCPLIAAGEQN